MNDTFIRRAALTGVVISATVLSYSTLHHRALTIGIPEWSAWFYPVLYDAFILGASRTWQNHELSRGTRRIAKYATLGGIIAAVLAFIIEFSPFGLAATFGALMIPAVMATALVLTSRAAADRKRAAEKLQDEPEVTPAVVVPDVAPEPVATKLDGGTAVAFEPTFVTVAPGVKANDAPVIVNPESIPRTTLRKIDFEPTDKREWINTKLDAGEEVTGAMIDRKFGGRNGARTLKSVLAARETRNGVKV